MRPSGGQITLDAICVRRVIDIPADKAAAETPAVEKIRINRETLRANDRILSSMYQAVSGSVNMLEEDGGHGRDQYCP